MNYNERIKITTVTKAPGYLDDEIISRESRIVACNIANLSNEEQIGIFGKYNQDAFKAHIQGIWKDFESIEYDGVERSVFSKRYHRNSTVVIMT